MAETEMKLEEQPIDKLLEALALWFAARGWVFDDLALRKPGAPVVLHIESNLLGEKADLLEKYIQNVNEHWEKTKHIEEIAAVEIPVNPDGKPTIQ
ncbi:MAG: hypothetical protein WC322_04885 [Candidatus Paceibacterota bacterium]|jgi:hypothetical protein